MCLKAIPSVRVVFETSGAQSPQSHTHTHTYTQTHKHVLCSHCQLIEHEATGRPLLMFASFPLTIAQGVDLGPAKNV